MNPGGGGSKNTAAPEMHAGLDSADIVPGYAWNGLLDSEGLPYKFDRYFYFLFFSLYYLMDMMMKMELISIIFVLLLAVYYLYWVTLNILLFTIFPSVSIL